MTQDDTFPPGTRIGNYEVMSRLGKGGMGVVYLVRQVFLQKRFALKVLNADLAVMPEFVQVFRHEAQTLASLHHPHIVQVHDFGEWQGRSYFVMDYIAGGTVDDRRRLAGGALAPAETLVLMRELASGLAYAHDLGIVHRDLKPENFLLDESGRAKITDFGLAKLSRLPAQAYPQRTRGHTFMHFARAAQSAPELTGGTEGYMAPELKQGAPGDSRSDIYAMGVIAFQLLTGAMPSPGSAGFRTAMAGLDPRWGRVLSRCLAEDPGERYAAGAELSVAFDDLAGGMGKARHPLPAWFWALPVPVLAVSVFAAAILFRGVSPAPGHAESPGTPARPVVADPTPYALPAGPAREIPFVAEQAELGYGLVVRGEPPRIEGWMPGSRAVWSRRLHAGRYRVSLAYALTPALGAPPLRLTVNAGSGTLASYLPVSAGGSAGSRVRLGEIELANGAKVVEVELKQGSPDAASLRIGTLFFEHLPR